MEPGRVVKSRFKARDKAEGEKAQRSGSALSPKGCKRLNLKGEHYEIFRWLQALDAIGISEKRKHEITCHVISADFEVFAPFQSIHALPDFTGALHAYLYSDLGGADWHGLQQASDELLAEQLTKEESRLLKRRAEAMDAISRSTPLDYVAEGEDYIDFVSSFADDHDLDCYIQCYTARLERLYGYFGFEILNRSRIAAFPIEERFMVRRARRATQ